MKSSTAALILAATMFLPGVIPAAAGEDEAVKAPAGSGEAGGRGASETANLDISPEAVRSVTRALAFMSTQQARDGSFSAPGGQHRAAMTGLAGLAYLSAGHTPGRGKHAREVTKAIEFLLKLQDREGCYADDGGRSMHGHGYALHFMAEAYGMTTDPRMAARLRDSVTKGVRLTARAQSKEGGWYYQPTSNQGHEGSITITQVQAVWAARQAGINVPQKTIDKGIDYMRKSQQPDGGICYMLGQPGSRPALSAAGVMVFCGYGMRDSKEAAKAIGYMRRMLGGKLQTRIGMNSGFDHYATLYLGQALYQAGDPDWSRHYPKLCEEIMKQQQPDGGWQSNYGPVFGTACYTLVLAIPYQYLPTFQR